MMLKLNHKKKWKNENRRLSGSWDTRLPKTGKKIAQLQLVIKRLSPSWQACIPIACLIVPAWSYAAVAQDAPTAAAGPTTAELKVALDTLWVAIAAFLVFFMNAGFCMLETGFCRQKTPSMFWQKT